MNLLKQCLEWLVWVFLGALVVLPVVEAAFSPLQQGRNVAYVIGGLSGIAALSLLLLQPLLGAGYVPGIHRLQQQRWHQRIGALMVVSLALHIAGLYLTSPDDVTDALLLVAPTPFSVYGVVGLWSVVLTALLVAMRSKLRTSPLRWKLIHNLLAIVVVVSSVVHSLMIEGAMGEWSKRILCAGILIATTAALLHLRVFKAGAKKSA